jgi:nucleotide-binding universal stress UspA family protein
MPAALATFTDSNPYALLLKNIVVATDFAPSSERALERAELIAHRCGAKVHLVHVMSPPADHPFQTDPTPEIFSRNRYEARMLLRGATGRFMDIPHESWLEMGDVSESVSAVCRRVKADLAVVGTQGKTGVAKLLLGSTAEKIFRSVPCPVLTVGVNTTIDDGGKRLEHILFPTDFTFDSAFALPYVAALALSNEAQLTVLHVVPQANPKTEASINSFRHAYCSDFEGLLKKMCHLQKEPRFVPEFNKSIADGINTYAAKAAVKLIVLGVRSTPTWATYLPGTAQKVAALAPCPVLTVRSPGGTRHEDFQS